MPCSAKGHVLMEGEGVRENKTGSANSIQSEK